MDNTELIPYVKQITVLEQQLAALVEALEEIEIIGRNARSKSKAVHMGNIARQALALVEGDEDGI